MAIISPDYSLPWVPGPKCWSRSLLMPSVRAVKALSVFHHGTRFCPNPIGGWRMSEGRTAKATMLALVEAKFHLSIARHRCLRTACLSPSIQPSSLRMSLLIEVTSANTSTLLNVISDPCVLVHPPGNQGTKILNRYYQNSPKIGPANKLIQGTLSTCSVKCPIPPLQHGAACKRLPASNGQSFVIRYNSKPPSRPSLHYLRFSFIDKALPPDWIKVQPALAIPGIDINQTKDPCLHLLMISAYSPP